MPDEGDIRDAVSEAWTKLESTPEAAPAAVAAPPAPSAPEPQPKAEPAPDGRVRDEQGRFTKPDGKPAAASNGTPPARASDAGAQGEAVKDAPGGPPAAVAAQAAPPASVLKAPQSWTPEERAAFDLAPPAAQKAALRREAEITRALNETAEPRKLKEAVAPFEHMFRAAGLSAPQAVGNVLQKYAALQTAPMQVRADIVAELFSSFIGTDEASINLLASALDKRGRGGGPSGAPAAAISPQQIQAMVQQSIQQERQEVRRQSTAMAIQQFEASPPEHFDIVAGEFKMLASADEREHPDKQWTVERLNDVYAKACLLNQQVREIEEQKKEAKQAATANAATQKARASAVSVKSNPVGPAAPPPPGDDTRSHMAASWERLAGQ